MLEKIKESAAFIQSKTSITPSIGIILGTGLGGLVKEINVIDTISYENIPNFPVSTVESHSGKLIFGELGGKKVVAMQGRFHYYEGYSLQQVTFPVRVMKLLGIERLFVSNASGGVNPDFEVGEIMIQDDHINLFPGNPLIGKNIDELGPRFPDMSDPYDPGMIALAKQIASENNIKVSVGIYAGLTGPTLETPAEYQYVRNIGADAVGMSTVPEVIVARHMEIPCFAISIITDLGVKGKIQKVSVQDVIEVASRQEPKMTLIMRELISRI
ncbi:MAG: purine-nucleoside phosphorylase [Bacteroidetes bacterium]|nr:purine-nucleoside phosphorylase [Bacteroidota bacterium]